MIRMFAARLSQVSALPVTRFVISSNRGSIFLKPGSSANTSISRCYTSRFKDRATRLAQLRKPVVGTETSAAPEAAFNLGKGAVAGGAVLGLGALCYYGLGFSAEPGVLENSMVWPQYVRDRIQTTYLYFGSSIALTAGSAVAAFRSPVMMRMLTKNSFLSIGATMVAMIGSGMLVQSLPYKPGFGTKQLAWMAHTAILGACVAPICFIGGPILMRAAWYTAGVVGGLSTVAACAPSDKFLNLGGPLAIGLGVVFASSLGSMFLPPTGALGAGLYSISLYGGLLLFSGFLLYDTQRIVRKAETHSPYAVIPYDPINASMSIYLDTLNIFIRIATILAGGGNKRR